jgi:hypothetical protein
VSNSIASGILQNKTIEPIPALKGLLVSIPQMQNLARQDGVSTMGEEAFLGSSGSELKGKLRNLQT